MLSILLALALLQSHRVPASDETVRLRAEGPAALEHLLTRFDLLPSGPEKDDLERTIDAVAAQRYATVSRLYWYTDLAAAQAAARASGRPILSLRMLGRLDEDRSCANSRLFRVVLYANADVSRFLRESFVLHWSSERPAPKVTVDFGDGRKIETTVGGNSAHLVLDADGRPIDVLPGLYSPVAFRRELEACLPLAHLSPSLDDGARAERLLEHHRARAAAAASLWTEGGRPVAFPIPSRPSVFAAEGLTMGKRMIETPAVVLAALGGPGRTAGIALGQIYVRRLDEARLDAASRALVARLRPIDWAADPKPLDAQGLEAEIAVLEALVASDTEANETRLRAQVHAWFEGPPPDLATVLVHVYRELFQTPADDPWLGFSTPLIFTGLPGDGVLR